MLVVEDPKQLRALADPFRGRIVTLLRQRAASTTELADALQTPKGTVGHHLKVLERGGLVRVVRTRKVRALTEKYYGRVARLFVLKTDDSLPDDLKRGALAAMMLRTASDELIAARVEKETSAILHARLSPRDVRRFEKRLNRLVADFNGAEDAGRRDARPRVRAVCGTHRAPPARPGCLGSGRRADSGATRTS